MKNYKNIKDEIDLVNLILLFWRKKWIIILFIVISYLVAFSYLINKKQNFTAISDVTPISFLDGSKYAELNRIDLCQVISCEKIQVSEDLEKTKIEKQFIIADENDSAILKIKNTILLEDFIKILNERKIFEEAIDKYRLLDSSQYDNEKLYNVAVTKLASSIKIIKQIPLTKNNNNKDISKNLWKIKFVYDDEKKWKDVLEHVNVNANKLIRQILDKNIQNFFYSIERKKEFLLSDLETKLENIKEDYKNNMKDRILYLNEQASIAEVLGIDKDSLEVAGKKNVYGSNVIIERPFYLRGYEAINKEIELIENRKIIEPFINELREIEKRIRGIQQDKSLDRVKSIYQKTPLAKKDGNFVAGLINVASTEIKFENNKKFYTLALFLGAIIGIFFVLFNNAIQLRKT
tara:strand:+ start:741 stop:1958 length:1218 start_codon:yes stop_codon:yes gene_type:complete